MDAEENERPAVEAGRSRAGLGGVNAVRARALRALLDLELDLLPAGQTVEVEREVEAAAMEEVLFASSAEMKPKPRSATTFLMIPVVTWTSKTSRTRGGKNARSVRQGVDHAEHHRERR
jgi:hypothetical protein